MDAALEQRRVSWRAPEWLRGERLYWQLQAAGWGFILLLDLVKWAHGYHTMKPSFPAKAHPVLFLLCDCVIPMGGLLVSHLGRSWARRRGWQRLPLPALAPRIVLLSLVQGALLLWTYDLVYGTLIPAASQFLPPAAYILPIFSVSGDFLGWWGLYFVYQLFGRLAQTERDSLLLAARIKEAELLALKAQVNPHFMFNALNSVRALIKADPDRARQAVTRLAGLLRFGLQSGRMETIPFADELRATRDYLELEQLRYEERLRLRIEVAPDVLALPIPPMLLQTLAENAVKHGIASCAQGGEIAIDAWCEGGALRLEVANTCPPGAVPDPDFSTGTGIRNAAERARLLFGPEAILRLRADGSGRFIAEVMLPGRQPAVSLR